MNLADRIVVMAHGRIQQVGTPNDLYRRPRTRFVAEFVGRNNFLSGRVEALEGSEALVVLESGAKVRVVMHRAIAVGGRVELAVRPEHVMLDVVAEGISARVEERRFLGNLVHYSVRLPSGEALLVEMPSDGALPEPGSEVMVSWRQDHAHLFDMQGDALNGA